MDTEKKKLPILVTYRSAEKLRDAGIRYAYWKAGQYISGFIAFSAFVAGSGSYFINTTPIPYSLIYMLLAISILSLLVGHYCFKSAIFPHTPCITIDELETMRDKMGIPASVIKRVQDNVIVGSMQEWEAMSKTDEVIKKAQKSSWRTKDE